MKMCKDIYEYIERYIARYVSIIDKKIDIKILVVFHNYFWKMLILAARKALWQWRLELQVHQNHKVVDCNKYTYIYI